MNGRVFATMRWGFRGGVARMLVVALCGGFVSGCGRSGPAVAYVQGVVLLDGKPVAEATVGFSPVDGGRPAVGSTDDAGRFTLTSTGGGRVAAGAAVGKYVVVISKHVVETVTGPGSASPEADRPPESWPAYEQSPPKPPKVTYVIPASYGDAAISGLTAEVVPGNNEFRFELESESRRRP